MELKQYIRLLWRWSWLLILSAVLFGTGAFVLSRRMDPVYAASTTLLINQTPVSSAAPDYNSLLVSERLAQTYGELLRKRPVLQAVITNLKLDTDTVHLAERTKVSIVRDTQFIVLTVEDTSPQLAADIANQIAEVFSQQNRELQMSRYVGTKQNLQEQLDKIQVSIADTQTKLDTIPANTNLAQVNEKRQLQTLLDQYQITYQTLLKSFGEVQLAEAQMTADLSVVEAAQLEPKPVRPRTLLNTLLAAIMGSLFAIGLAFLVEYFDDTVKLREDIEKLIDVPTLAAIVRVKSSDLINGLVIIPDIRSPIAEAYRMLRTNIEFSAITKPLHTIVVTSSSPFEGKSTTAANLAIVFAQAGKRVILVDTDLRRPMLHTYFRQTNEQGLTTALLQQATSTPSEPLRVTRPRGRSQSSIAPQSEDTGGYLFPTGLANLSLMPSGPLPPNPADLLGSHWMDSMIEKLKTQADLVIFDSPPVLAVVDATLLARSCDVTLLVTRAGYTRAGPLKQARDQLLQSGATLLGTVLNGVSARNDHYNYYYPSRGTPRSQSSRWQGRLSLAFLHRKARGAAPDSLAATISADAARAPEPNHREDQQPEKPRAETPIATRLVPIAQELNGKLNQHNGDTT